jgi:DNA polymerase
MSKQQRMDRLRLEIEACTRCSLCAGAKHKVPGEGNLDASIMLVGEAPGRREDEHGRPFVGSAGKLLDKLLAQAGLSRSYIFIGNVVKCRPPGNRRPKREEAEACAPHLAGQMETIAPKVVAPMGNSAVEHIFKAFKLPEAVIGDVHGRAFNVDAPWGKATVFPLYHPAAAIYNRKLLSELEEDMRGLRLLA